MLFNAIGLFIQGLAGRLALKLVVLNEHQNMRTLVQLDEVELPLEAVQDYIAWSGKGISQEPCSSLNSWI